MEIVREGLVTYELERDSGKPGDGDIDIERNYIQSSSSQPVLARIKAQFSTLNTVKIGPEAESSDSSADQVVLCIASVLQAQMVEDYGASPEDKALHPIFNQRIEPAHGLGGDVSEVDAELLQREAPEDEYLRDLLRCRAVPPVKTISNHMQTSTECNIVALMYLSKLNAPKRFILTFRNWRCVWASCFILAQKMWSNKPLKSSSFEKMCPPLKKADLRRLEAYSLVLLGGKLGIRAPEYAAYYLDLKQLYLAIGFNESDWQFRELSVLQAARMTALCEKSEAVNNKTAAHMARNKLALFKPSSDKELRSFEAKVEHPRMEIDVAPIGAVGATESKPLLLNESPKPKSEESVGILRLILNAFNMGPRKIFP